MIHLVASLIAAAVGLAGDGGRAAELVGRLGAPRFEDREAAAKALRAIGYEALPTLRAAVHAKDAEVRARATRLLDEVRSDWLTTPTRLSLDFQDRPAADIARAIDGRNGVRLTMLPPFRRTGAAPGPGRITLRSNGPMTFWEAIDRLCEAAGQTPLPSDHFAGSVGDPMLFLMPRGQGAGDSPHVASGVFRVSLESLELSGEHRPGKRGAPGRGAEVSARLMFEAEPRMLAIDDGPCEWLEAVDDAGQSLVRPGRGGAGPRRYAEAGGFGQFAMGTSSFGTGPRFVVSAPLPAPDRPGRTLRTLRGTMPVLLAMREPEPLVVPLDRKGGGEEVRDDRVAIAVGSSRFGGPGGFPGAEIQLTLRTIAPEPIHGRLLPYQIDVLDAEGTRFKLVGAHITVDPGVTRVNLNLSSTARPKRPENGGRPSFEGKEPVRLHFYHVFRATADVAFRFEDLPLP